jgi:hypothetical protein
MSKARRVRKQVRRETRFAELHSEIASSIDARPDEAELIDTLVRRKHLSVPGRRALPDGKAKGNLILDAIERIVCAEGSLGLIDGGLNASLERLPGGACRVSWEAEVGMMRFEIVRVVDFPSPRMAAAAVMMSQKEIDGVAIEWNA